MQRKFTIWSTIMCPETENPTPYFEAVFAFNKDLEHRVWIIANFSALSLASWLSQMYFHLEPCVLTLHLDWATLVTINQELNLGETQIYVQCTLALDEY